MSEEDDVVRALRRITPGHLFCGARAIVHAPIHPQERCLYTGVVDKVRDQTATGRLLAREVLRNMGVSPRAILRNEGGAPDFGAGVVGSIAHDDEFAVCVAGAGVNVAIGVDVEPALPLPAELLHDVAVTYEERAAVDRDAVFARLLFAAKEAVYKACFPVERVFYEFADVRLVGHVAAPRERMRFTTKSGATVVVEATRSPRILAVAHVETFAPLGQRT